ncbi:MAG: hypothetical protein GY929_26240 [Actinomycetia bacterium]|nr:hypothetical protein [Actinomycetes bacterium]
MADPRFESPVSTPGPTAGPLTLVDESATSKLVVRAFPEGPALHGVPFASSAMVGPALVVGIRPHEWWVLGDADDVMPDPSATVVDLTHGRARFRLTGEHASGVLEMVCSLDWSDPMTPDGSALSASVAKVSCDIVRHDQGSVPSYLILADRSLGQYLFDALLDATHTRLTEITAIAEIS